MIFLRSLFHQLNFELLLPFSLIFIFFFLFGLIILFVMMGSVFFSFFFFFAFLFPISTVYGPSVLVIPLCAILVSSLFDSVWCDEQAHAHYSFGPLSLCLSMNYLDRFLSVYHLPVSSKNRTMFVSFFLFPYFLSCYENFLICFYYLDG